MVLPFLGVYMTAALGFTLKEAGVVLSFFGLGSVLGSIAGGWLTDKYGHFIIQSLSLFLAVPVFIFLPYLKGLNLLSSGIFVLSFITQVFRPANSVSISYYALPENITRAFSLNRMALNLGFSMGPALGGLLAAFSYKLLFYGNAFSVGVAGIVFYFYFHQLERRRNQQQVQENEATTMGKKAGISPWRDGMFITFSILCCLYGVCFFQFISTLPLYYKGSCGLNNQSIGFLIGFNGLVVFTLEMLLVSVSERRLKISKTIMLGSLLCGFSFLVLLTGKNLLILYLAMLLLSISEIFFMPFMATVAINRAHKSRKGAYMGMNSLSFSLALVFAPYLGTRIAGAWGFKSLWWCIAILGILISIGFRWNLKKMLK